MAIFYREIDELNSQLKKFNWKAHGDDCPESMKACFSLFIYLFIFASKVNNSRKLILFSYLFNFQQLASSTAGDQECVVQIQKGEDWNQDFALKHSEEILNFQLELDILKIILDEERLTRNEVEQKASKLHEDLQVAKNDLEDAKSVIEALESQQILSINELEEVRQKNNHYLDLLSKKDSFLKQSKDGDSPLQTRLKRVQTSLEHAKKLNMRFQSDQASITSQQREMEEVQSQVEAETAEVIVCLQEELSALQQQIDELSREKMGAKEENKQLRKIVDDKTVEQRVLTEEWNRLASEVSDVLADGNIMLQDTSYELEDIDESLPNRRIRLSEQVGRMARLITEKDMQIEELQKNIDDAYKIRDDLELKMRYLRGATLTLTEAQEEEKYEREKEIIHLKTEIQELRSVINESQNMLKIGEDRIRKAEVCSTVAFITVNRLTDKYLGHLDEMKGEVKKAEFLRQLKQEGTISSSEPTEEKGHVLVESEISDDLLGTRGQLAEFQRTISAINSNMNEYVADVGRSKKVENKKPMIEAAVDDRKSGGWVS